MSQPHAVGLLLRGAGEHVLGQGGELLRAQGPHQFGQHGGEARVQGGLPGEASGLLGHARGHHGGDVLERLVLQQPGEQQVPGLQESLVRLRVRGAGWQQPGGLEVQQGGGHHQELAGLVQRGVGHPSGCGCRGGIIPGVRPLGQRGPGGLAQLGDVGDELISHRRQGHLGDVHLAPCDQREQDIEGTGEVGEAHGEAGGAVVGISQRVSAEQLRRVWQGRRGAGPGGHGAPPLQISSRASWR